MQYAEFKPSEKYSGFIKMFWTLEGDGGYLHHSLADVCCEMLFHLEGIFDELFETGTIEKSFRSGVHGPGYKPRRFNIQHRFQLFGVSFYPHVLPFLFQMPASELANQMPDLATLLRSEGIVLEEKIMRAPNHAGRAKIMEDFLDKKLNGVSTDELRVFDCIRTLATQQQQPAVQALCQQYFLSERQLQRQFRQYAGLSPKLFSRVVRFSNATGFYGATEKSLTSIALECGYYDQSHFIHDFKKFSGLHPRHYFSGATAATTWKD